VSGQLEIRGSLMVRGSADCLSGAGADTLVKALGEGCPKSYNTIIATAKPIQVLTAGAVGAAWDEMDILDDLAAIEFLMVRTQSPFRLRIGADEAVLVGTGGTFPTSFAGGETLDLSFVTPGSATVAVSVAFLAGDQTAAQCAARINAACALAGLATPRATVRSDGQLEVRGLGTGEDATVTVTGGTGAGTLGLSGSASGAGADVDVQGLFINEFPRSASPARLQVSGQGSITIVAGGRETM
jgi:hypothetical protein